MTAEASGGGAGSVEQTLEAGIARRAAGDLAGAAELFGQVLAADPDEATALYLLGVTRFEAGDAAAAQALIERLAALRPNNAVAQFTLASICHWRDDRPGAVSAYRRALELDEANAGAWTGLSRALAETGDFQGAVAAADAAVARAADDPSARLALAAAHRGLGEVLEAAAAFAEAARLAPDLVMAHVGRSMAMADAGEATEARLSAERAVALDPSLCDAWLALGAARRGLHDPNGAREAFERALALDPDRAVVQLNLGLALIELERPAEARRCLTRAIELDPASAKAHANLSSLYYLAGRKTLAKAHALRALAIDPELMSAHQNLAALLAEEQKPDEAKAHRDLAYAEHTLVITTAAHPRARVLILSTTESGNTPDRYLIPPAAYTRLMWFIEYADPARLTDLPPFDIAFNAIGDEDLAGPTAANATAFAAVCPTRLINPPDLIARTRRDLVEDLFGGVADVKIPRTARLAAAELGGRDVREVAASAGVGDAFLVRPIGSHGGKGLHLVRPGEPLEPLTSAGAYYLTEFVDFAAADGLHRKYRVVFVDGRALPYHLAISPSWMVHYESSGIDKRPDLLAEEMRFLEDPPSALGDRAWAAVNAIGAAMGLGYAGVDFSLLRDGRLLLFEANATMLVHPEAADGPLAHKNPIIQRIFDAFAEMLARG